VDRIEKQMEVASLFLERIHDLVDEEAVVAGGACRDWWMGKPCNDIDIYLRTFAGDEKNALEKALEEPLNILQDVNTEYYQGNNFTINRIISFRWEGENFQIMFCDPYSIKDRFDRAVVDHIDTGINRVYSWNPTSKVALIPSIEFLRDIENKTITFFESELSESQKEHSQANHLPKMKKYFPDYKLLSK
jgi:hypothetical protein